MQMRSKEEFDPRLLTSASAAGTVERDRPPAWRRAIRGGAQLQIPGLTEGLCFMQQPQRAFEGRSTFVDALRGIAALSVACYHIFRYGPLPEPAAQVVPGILQIWFDHGWIGVQVFFVISGFVIAYSVRDARITPGYLTNYALRRSIRLDPPYWTTIAIVLVVHWIFHLHLGFDSPMDVPSPMETPLSWRLLLAHVFYLQNILGYENLSAGFWTLCIEVQFYLLYVVGMGLVQRLSSRMLREVGQAHSMALLGFFAPIAVLSLFVWNLNGGGPPGNEWWITHFFCMFFLGCVAWWALDRRVPAVIFWGYALLMAVCIAGRVLSGLAMALDLTVALVAGIGIYMLGRRGRLGTEFNYRPIQYLGRISYSLYLIHFPVAHVVTTLGYEHMTINHTLTPSGAAACLLAALLASIATAHVLYTFVEAPSIRLASRLKSRLSLLR